MHLFKELRRRNVFRVAIGYVVSSWLLAQVADLVLENIGAPDWVMQTIMLVLALGFPVVVFFSWVYEVTPEGIRRESMPFSDTGPLPGIAVLMRGQCLKNQEMASLIEFHFKICI